MHNFTVPTLELINEYTHRPNPLIKYPENKDDEYHQVCDVLGVWILVCYPLYF